MLIILLIAMILMSLLFLLCACVIQVDVLERRKIMNKLEMYKKLSNEDKDNLSIYNIYHAIYCIA